MQAEYFIVPELLYLNFLNTLQFQQKILVQNYNVLISKYYSIILPLFEKIINRAKFLT